MDSSGSSVGDADSEAEPVWKVLTVPPESAGARLDQWLAAALRGELSRSRLQDLIRQGAVTVRDRVVTEPRHKLRALDEIAMAVPDPEAAAPRGEDIPLDILHEDAEIIVVNKPAGLVVHPAAGNWTGTLVNALIHHCGDSLSGIGGVRRPGIVHRLDKDTSGVMVVAKTDRAHKALAEAFADHGRAGDLERAYVALVWGVPARRKGTVNAALGRAADRVRRAVVPEDRSDARHAVTHYEVMETFGDRLPAGAAAALLECRLETGRTHQIRVHMAHIGHPLVGDRDYAAGFSSKANPLPEPARSAALAFPRQALHARLLAFRHPASGALLRFEAPPPSDFAGLLDAFRGI
jgi:23S rRNA pseudouridine1911/1915/1917 synthase